MPQSVAWTLSFIFMWISFKQPFNAGRLTLYSVRNILKKLTALFMGVEVLHRIMVEYNKLTTFNEINIMVKYNKLTTLILMK